MGAEKSVESSVLETVKDLEDMKYKLGFARGYNAGIKWALERLEGVTLNVSGKIKPEVINDRETA